MTLAQRTQRLHCSMLQFCAHKHAAKLTPDRPCCKLHRSEHGQPQKRKAQADKALWVSTDVKVRACLYLDTYTYGSMGSCEKQHNCFKAFMLVHLPMGLA